MKPDKPVGWVRTAVGLSLLIAISAAEPNGHSRQSGQAPPAGASLFKSYCASCHGASGRGDGPVAELFRKPPPDLTQIAKRHNGVFPREKVFRIIDGRDPIRGHGGPDMPVWGEAFSRSSVGGDEATVRRKIQALVSYLEAVQERLAEQ